MSARRPGLGRGLDALLKEDSAGVHSLAIDQLRPNRYQPRTSFDDTGLDELAESIRSQGVIQPLVVRAEEDGSYSIVAGERRWRAAQRAGLDTVPVVIREVGGDRELLELALVENLQREDLNPVEEAEAYVSLQEKFDLSQEEIAVRVGKGRSTVANALRLLKLPSKVLDLLRDGQLTAGQARPLLALTDEDELITLAERASQERLTARQLERLVAEPKKRKAAGKRRKVKPEQPQEVNTAAAQEKLTRRLQTKVEIRRKGQGGVLNVHFHSEEELMRLYDLFMDRGEQT